VDGFGEGRQVRDVTLEAPVPVAPAASAADGVAIAAHFVIGG
jgi:hypothetical protein